MQRAGRKTTLDGTFFDQALLDLASRQHLVFSLEQLRGLGLSSSGVRKRVAASRLHRIHQAVYSLVPREHLGREGLYMAAVLACGEGAVLSHRSAARLLELRNYGYWKIEVTVPTRYLRTHPGVAVHRSSTLTDKDLIVVEGIPVTTIARTLLDVAELITPRQLERAFDQGESLQALDLNAINDQLARNPTRPGAKAVKAVLREHYIGSTQTENDFEEAFLALTRSLGLPDPRAQYHIDPGDGEPPIRADFAWPDRRIVVETDGRKTHATNQAFETDR